MADVGAHGIVYEQVFVGVGAYLEGGEGAVVAFATAGQYVGDLGVGGGDVAHVADVVCACDDDDAVYVGVGVKSNDGVFEYGLAVHLEKLLGLVCSEAGAAAAGQEYCCGHWCVEIWVIRAKGTLF